MSSITVTARDAGINALYIAHNDATILEAAVVPSGATKIDLDKLPLIDNNPAIAESRLLLAMATNPDQWIPAEGYVGVLHASYDEKFSSIPKLVELPGILAGRLVPDKPVSPLTVFDYMSQAQDWHMGMPIVLKRILDNTGVKINHKRPGPLTNSVIAHSDVWRRFLPAWLRMYVAASDQIKGPQTYDTRHCKPGIAPAYLLERFTTAWFAAQDDLQCLTMTGKNGSYYSTRGGKETAKTTKYHGDLIKTNEVTINGPR